MERINTFAFCEIGAALQPLKAQRQGSVPGNSVMYPLIIANWRMDSVIAGNPIEIVLCKQSAVALRDTISKLVQKISPRQQPDGKFGDPEWTAIPDWEWNGLAHATQKFETVFAAEMENAATYSVPRRGLYSTPALVNEAETSFPPEISSEVPEKAKADFHEAGRCLAFNLPTAAGFHACRAVEGMLEVYYQRFTGKTNTLKGWNDYVEALRKVIKATPDKAPEEKTLHNIDQIRSFDRNPLMHPRETLELMDARILFSTAELAILGMAQEVKRLAEMEDAAQPELAMITSGGPAQ